ncbi:mycothiol synthase [Jatrophihabitans sp.]|uniref:mycothiol synthase n=1 Tax=Jatrophihabitans sp. TaxID=1932789 RepID=UPI0030C6949C|nr:mshD [Jatrophihabitans sp.]
MPVELSSPAGLSADERAQVRALAERIEARDGQPPLSDQALTQLSSGGVAHLLAHDGGVLVGYGQLDGSDGEVMGEVDEIVDSWAGRLRTVWSHGKRSGLGDLLATHGYLPTRTLHQLRRSTKLPLLSLPVPDDIRIAPFRIGQDEDDWVRVNAAAFAHHPEQGRLQRADIEAREAEPWFDPAGFLMAWRGTELLGYHWTKIHAGGAGEVYVIGIDPVAQGLGLGRLLLELGLAHLAERGCPEVLLYVDDTNTAAMRLYLQVGFEEYDVDVQWSLGD